jgi:hypothetical protein
MERLKQLGARLLLVLLLGAAAVAFSIKAYHGLRIATVAKSWPTVHAVVTRASKTDENFDRQPRATAVVRYEYRVDGKMYEGVERRDAVPVAEADELLKQYHKNLEFPIRYNPADPTESVIDSTPPGNTYLHIAIAVLAAICTLAMFCSLIMSLKGDREPSQSEDGGDD